MAALAGDAAARVRIGAAGRAVAEQRYGWAAAGAAMAAALDELVDRGSRPAASRAG